MVRSFHKNGTVNVHYIPADGRIAKDLTDLLLSPNPRRPFHALARG
jgi:hypothetical protein